MARRKSFCRKRVKRARAKDVGMQLFSGGVFDCGASRFFFLNGFTGDQGWPTVAGEWGQRGVGHHTPPSLDWVSSSLTWLAGQGLKLGGAPGGLLTLKGGC